MFPGGLPQNMQPGRQVPVVQYPGMYYSSQAVNQPRPSNSSSASNDGRNLLAESYERMRNEMKSLQGSSNRDAPPAPSMDKSKDNVAIKMLLNNDAVSLSSLLEAAMDPTSGSNKGTEDPIMKKAILDKCEGKIAQLYRHRISGMGTFFPSVPSKGAKSSSSSFLVFHHPRIQFNMEELGTLWTNPEVSLEGYDRKNKLGKSIVSSEENSSRAKSPALEAAEEYANKPNPSLSGEFNQEPVKIPVLGGEGLLPNIPSVSVPRIPIIDLSVPPPPISTPAPPPLSDPYSTSAFELWAAIEKKRRLEEKLKDLDKKEDRKKKKKRKHKRSRSRSGSRDRSRSRSGSWSRSRSRRSRSRSRSRHREKSWRSRSRRRSRSIYLSPSPPRRRSKSPRYRRGSRSPGRPSSRNRVLSPMRILPNNPTEPPKPDWPVGSHWPQGPSSATSEFYQSGIQSYPDSHYYGNNQPYPPYNVPPIRYPAYPPRGYPLGVEPQQWRMRGPPSMIANPFVSTSPIKSTKNDQRSSRVVSVVRERVVREVAITAQNPVTRKSVTVSPAPVVIIDDEDEPKIEDKRMMNSIDDHPPGVTPEREIPKLTETESKFTKPLRAMFRRMLKPFEKILDFLKKRQRDTFEYKTLIKGLEIGSCEFDGVYTLIDGILCRVVMKAVESRKTCFKIVTTPNMVMPLLVEIHTVYHYYNVGTIKRKIDEIFHSSEDFTLSKIDLVFADCKVCKAEREKKISQKKSEEVKRKTSEKDVNKEVDPNSKRRSRSKSREDRKKAKDVDNKEKGDARPGKSSVRKSPKKVERTANQISGDLKGNRGKCGEQTSLAVKANDAKLTDGGKEAASVGANEMDGTKSASNDNKIKNEGGSVTADPPGRVQLSIERCANVMNKLPLEVGKPVDNKEPAVKNKPEDFKIRVRTAQMAAEDLKTLIIALEGPEKTGVDSSYLLKAGMLCKRILKPDGKTDVKIVVTPQTLLKMIQIVHTMASSHAPLDKTISVFNKHFTSIRGVQEAVSIVLNNCEECKS